MASKKTISLIIIVVTILLSISYSINTTQATDELNIIQEERFEIPAQNSTITFTTNGTFQDARLEGDLWNFINLQFTGSPQQEKLNLTASAKNCDVTITSYRSTTSNTTLGSRRLRYTVVEEGTQSFNFGVLPESGMWSVVINGVFVGQEDGWTVSAKTTVIVNGAASNSNVSIIYYTYPNSFLNLSNQNFLERNSVTIATATVLTITIVIAVAAKKIVTKPQEDPNSTIKNKMNRKEKQ